MVLQWNMLVYFMNIWTLLKPFDTFYGRLVYFVVIWYIFSPFGILYQEKSGNLRPIHCVCSFSLEKDSNCT
jgi:hypothetical protein